MKESGFLDRMRTKKTGIVFTFIVISSGIIWLFGSPPTAYEDAVSYTHKGARNLHSSTQKNQVTVNPLYLSRLGLTEIHTDEAAVDAEKASPKSREGHRGLQPVLATSFNGQDWESVRIFIQSVVRHMPGYRLVVFDLTSSELTPDVLQTYCNSTQNCEIRRFDFEKYPSHVADLSIKSYRPICIQEMLKVYRSVIWADSSLFFRTGNISWALDQARTVGLLAWTIEHPTSAITHPSMFHFLHTSQDLYFFHRAVESSHLIVVDSPLVRKKIMLPWVKCALQEECISPLGAQKSGCNFMRKPLFKYSGCHFYDMSALNVILGLVFDFDERPYAAKENIFGSQVVNQFSADNTSNPLHRSRLTARDYINVSS